MTHVHDFSLAVASVDGTGFHIETISCILTSESKVKILNVKKKCLFSNIFTRMSLKPQVVKDEVTISEGKYQLLEERQEISMDMRNHIT